MLRSLAAGLSRSCLRNAPRFGFRSAFSPRRGMASGSHHAASSDKAWIVGSLLLFGPALVYLLGPGSAKVVTGHGNPSKDPHPSGHGAAPAPLMKKVTTPPQLEDVEKEESALESEESHGNAEQAQEQEKGQEQGQEQDPETSNNQQNENEGEQAKSSPETTPSNKTPRSDDSEKSPEHQEDNANSSDDASTQKPDHSTHDDNSENKAS